MLYMAQLARAAEYTDCIHAEEKDSPNKYPRCDKKKIGWLGSSNAGALGNVEHPLIAIDSKSTLFRRAST